MSPIDERPLEVEIPVGSRRLRARRWRQGTIPAIAVHGWQDNAGTFDLLAPRLPELDLVALDLAGHGRSDHRPIDVPYLGHLYVQDVLWAARHLGWDRFALIGHSLGAEVCAHIVRTFPERVLTLVCIDGFAHAETHLDRLDHDREALENAVEGSVRPPRTFPSTDAMSERVAEALQVEPAAAALMVARGSREVPGGWTWSADPRVRHFHTQKMSDSDVDHLLADYDGQILVIVGRHGAHWFRSTLDARVDGAPNLTVAEVPGGHHLHLEAGLDEAVALIRRHLRADG